MPATTTAFVGKGTTLGYSTATGAGPYTYTLLSVVKSCSPNITLGEAENVVLSSTFKGYLATIPEAECDLTVQLIPGDPGFVIFWGLVLSGNIAHWQLTFPDGSTITFGGFLKGFNPTVENESLVEGDATMRLTSMPVLTPAV